MKRTLQTFLLLVAIHFSCLAQTFTDVDGNVYQTVTIGTQIWMAENLKATHFQNGDSLKNITDPVEWASNDQDGYCYYNNDEAYDAVYGKIYNAYAATDGRNICPTGWHVPSDADWEVLFTSLGGQQVAGGKLKEAGTEHWSSPNTGATNESGCTALPGGGRWLESDVYDYGVFGGIHEDAAFWSTDFPTPVKLKYNTDSITYTMNNTYGSSIRCVFNGTAGEGEINPDQSIRIDPNPTTGIIKVSGDFITNIQVVNHTGALIGQTTSKTVDLTGQPDGIYFLKITTDKGVVTKKVVKK